MTAYELSDQLIECITDGSTDLVCVEQAAQIIRQQADRIAELEKENTDLVFRAVYAEKTMHMIERHYDQLEAQTKPLSDEEVWQVGRILGYEFINKNPNNVFLQFARAIEERHGIK